MNTPLETAGPCSHQPQGRLTTLEHSRSGGQRLLCTTDGSVDGAISD